MHFSIVATVRNENETIAAFVESLLKQTRKPDEIIIVDGESTDGTREILQQYELKGLLSLISRPCNIAQGRNIGIAAATGSHIAVTDAGCQVDAEWLDQIVQCFNADPAPDVVAGNFRFEAQASFEEAVVRATFQPNRDETQTARFYPSSRSVAFTKKAWQTAGGYPEWLYAAEDTLFNIRMRQLGLRFVFCRNAIVKWRPRSTWRSLARQRINFSRGNARVGIGTAGYLINLRIHVLMAILLVLGVWFPPMIIAAVVLLGWHVRKHFWSQAVASTPSNDWRMRLRIITIMEFVRIVNLYGFLLGRWDRISDETYVRRQMEYMGVTSVSNLDIFENGSDYRRKGLHLPIDRDTKILAVLALFSVAGGAIVYGVGYKIQWPGILPTFAIASIGTLALLTKSLLDFTQTGPRIRGEIVTHYRRYTLFALVRLSLWAFAIMLFTGGCGVTLYYMLNINLGSAWSNWLAALAATLGILGATILQFIRKLRFNPGLLVASMHYRMSRFYWLWRWMTPTRILLMQAILLAMAILLLATSSWHLVKQNLMGELSVLWGTALLFAGTLSWVAWTPEARPPSRRHDFSSSTKPNILMIGSDTLRADRLGSLGYHRSLTPNIDKLSEQGALFTNCYVPCARTAPSLISLMTGTWPHTHGIRDNYTPDNDTRLKVDALPHLLKAEGYKTAAISDWCGGDMGKFSFGFDYTDLPKDQWNLKYLIRQGPKDLRLFLSLFVHNRLGQLLIPEIYYLGGVPLTQPMGKKARQLLSRLTDNAQPFFLNVFYSTTHPPFASEWPWYMRFSDPTYRGESKFAMAQLTDPFEIIRRQGAPKEEFDLDQIIDLYDGCVAEFDDEVGKMLRHIKACGLEENTIIVIYSDHGMEFFEHDTWGQGNSAIGDYSARIPLAIYDPRKPARGKIDEVVRSVDIAPTLLELAGCKKPAYMEGKSLTSCLEQHDYCPQLDAYNETGIWIANIPGQPADHLTYPNLLELLEVPERSSGTLAIKPEYLLKIIAAKDRMIRRGRWKLTYQPLINSQRVQLFDLDNDPMCRKNVMDQRPDLAKELLNELARWIDGSPESKANH